MTNPREHDFQDSRGWDASPKPHIPRRSLKLARAAGEEAVAAGELASKLELALAASASGTR